jgi:hypothetical protein
LKHWKGRSYEEAGIKPAVSLLRRRGDTHGAVQTFARPVFRAVFRFFGGFLMSDQSPAKFDDGPISEPEQRLLFEMGSELLTVEEDARSGKYSGIIIEKNRQKVQAICSAIAEGHGMLRIAKAFGCSVHTVIGIRERNPELIAIEKKQLSRTCGKILAVCAERYLEGVISGAVPAAQIPVGMGIVFDKKALLDGEPTAIVARQEKQISVEDFNQYIAALPVAKPGEVARVSDSESGEKGANAGQ